MLLEGKKAIITGGTRGIGYAIACRFIEEGTSVTVFGSRQETADAAVEKLTAAYPDAKVWGRSCDLTSLEAVNEAFTQAAADMGGSTRSSTMPVSPSVHPSWTTRPRSSQRSWTLTSSPSLMATRLPPRS